ncbi:MAG: alpha/beta hydrolase [Alphaproteobacteria bacterium]|jgi:haloacetate dehalogenase|nr:alpha/beta hydrolase [Alphaproteobacteria bacterium]
MFEGFETRKIDTGEATIHVRVGGAGSAVVLLHGYPQSGACWHKLAPALAENYRVIIPDLRGYGDSVGPAPDADNTLYSKRSMASDIASVLDALSEEKAMIVGHDRGGRVAYRFALDHPDRTRKLAVLDMIPTSETWERLAAVEAIAAYHWPFLAQGNGLPERMIGHDPDDYLKHTLHSWIRVEGCFTEAAMAEYLRCFAKPSVIAACCADYRAGATVDWQIDRADVEAGNKIACPLLSLWGQRPGREKSTSLEVWSAWCSGPVSGGPIDSGHFLAEENPTDTLAALSSFLAD